MNITLNATDRKPLVKAISELTGEKAIYMKTPTYAYKIGDYTVTREGNLEVPDGLDAETLQQLKEAIEDAGFQMDDIEVPEATAEDSSAVNLPVICWSFAATFSNPETVRLSRTVAATAPPCASCTSVCTAGATLPACISVPV